MLPALGFTSDIMATFARKPIFGYKAMVGAMLGDLGPRASWSGATTCSSAA